MQLQTLGGTTFGDMQNKTSVSSIFDRAFFKLDGQNKTAFHQNSMRNPKEWGF